jgi:hypothetical protein
MAREAGLDPDGRIERPGQRSMPVWCTFRDAARKEHLAQEAADAANTIAAEKPQAPNFRTARSRCSASTTTRRLRRCAIACLSATSSPASSAPMAISVTHNRSVASLPAFGSV